MKKVLITGANGFIGSFLVEEAIKKNYNVYAGIRQTSNTKYLTDPGINIIDLNFADIATLQQQIDKLPYFDYIIHNAGSTKAVKKRDYFTSNYQYTKNVIDTLISRKKIPKKFVYISSLAAYGPGDPITLAPIKASDVARPVTSYGKSKLESEKYLTSLSGFPFIIIRPTAVYGPREKDLLTMFKLINKNLELFVGHKKQHLSFVYVRDLVKAVFQIMESNIVNKGYFVSDGNVYSGETLGNIIKGLLEKKTIRICLPIKLVRLIAATNELFKYITQKQPVLNLEKINELECVNWKCDIQPLTDDFSFKADYDLNAGVRETISWYKKENWL